MNPRTRRNAWIAWALVCVIWGTTYTCIKIALVTIPPFLMGGLRYFTGGVILAAILLARGHRLPARREWPTLALLGFLMIVLGHGGVVWGEQFVPSGLTAVIVATNPFWMVGIDAILPGGGRPHARQWLGLAVGFGGILLLVWPSITMRGHGGGFLVGVIALQIACAGWSLGSGYIKRHVMPADVLGAASLQMMCGGAFMLAIGTATGEWPALSFTPVTAAALVYLALAGSVVAFACFNYALQHLPVAIVSTYTYINPIIAVALGTIFLGEPFDARMILAAAIIGTGMAMVRS